MSSGSSKLLIGHGAASLAAVAGGVGVMAAGGMVTTTWALNLAAWAVGAVLAVALARLPALPATAPVWTAPLLLGLTLAVAPQIDGVQRWLAVGPLTLNAALLALPAAAVALALARDRVLAWAAAVCTGLVLALQPDASQATAWAFAVAVVALIGSRSRAALAAAILTAISAGVAWSLPDPLEPVIHVERIVPWGLALAPHWVAVGVAGSIAVIAVLVVTARRRDGVGLAAASLGAWTAAAMLAPAMGAFPQPLVGAGAAPVLGLWLAVGLLAGALRRGALEPKAV